MTSSWLKTLKVRDLQINRVSIIKAVAQKDKDKVNYETLMLTNMSEKAIAQLKDSVRQTLKDKMGDDKAA